MTLYRILMMAIKFIRRQVFQLFLKEENGKFEGQVVLEKLPTADEIFVVRVKDNGSPQLFTDQKIEIRFIFNAYFFHWKLQGPLASRTTYDHETNNIFFRLMNGTSSRWNFFTSPEFRFTLNDSTPFGSEIGRITGKGKEFSIVFVSKRFWA